MGQFIQKNRKNSPNFFGEMSSRILWGMNIDKTDCPLTKILIIDKLSAIFIKSITVSRKSLALG